MVDIILNLIYTSGDKYTQFTYGWDKMEQNSRTKTGCVVWNNLKWDVVPCVSKTYCICEYSKYVKLIYNIIIFEWELFHCFMLQFCLKHYCSLILNNKKSLYL